MPEPQNGWRTGFWSLIATQFESAFTDSALKSLVLFMVLAMKVSQQEQDRKAMIVNMVFAIPFLLFSMSGGYLADKFSKRTVAIWLKLMGVGVTVLALAALLQENLELAIVAVFLGATQNALFGPTKYGLLPELLPEDRLSWGNGILELGTFVAVIGASVAGAFMAERFTGHHGISGVIFLACASVGLFFSFGISRVTARDPQKQFRWNVLGDLWTQIRFIRKDRVLWLAVAGNTYFWFLGSLLQTNVVFYGKRVLSVHETQDAILVAAIGIGIGFGSFAAGYLSRGKIEYGLIPLGSMGITVFGFALAIHGLTYYEILGLLIGIGFAAGFFIVPINALIQHRPDDTNKGSVIAAANLLSFVGIGGASAIYFGVSHYLGWGPQSVFFWGALATVAATAYVIYLLPDSLLRLFLWFATNTLYRIDVDGAENIPKKGGALLTPNHASMVDAVLLIATTDRPIRFLMFRGSYEHWLVKPFAKILQVIPISSQQGPREMIRSLRDATQALQDGELVCIFPEGQMTRIGQMLPFRRGMERIMKGVEAPVIPVHIDGIWGSVFSFSGGKFLWKFPKQIPYRVSVTYGKPLPPTTTAQELRQTVQELGVDAFARRKKYTKTLVQSYIQMARRHPFRFAMADGRTARVSFFSSLVKSLFLARRLRNAWKDQPMVGLLLPPSIPGALVNYAAMLMGKVPVNLNYTASKESLESCAKQCGLKTVVTSKLFLEKVKIQPPGKVLFLEDIAEKPGAFEQVSALLAALFLSQTSLGKYAGADRNVGIDDTATIIFSSGSTGDPKGVVLTHYNVASNVEQLMQVFMLHKDDRILGILPFFHSFGFTGTLCLPAVSGIGVVFHPSPLDARAIGALVSERQVTLLLATPTFLNAFARRIPAEDFGSLRYVIAGAEKLPERISVAFEDQFGIRPLEGYGCTECSPVVAVNRVDFRAAQFRQVGAKRGSIGHPLPGMGIRIVNPENQQPTAIGETGLLLVRGPNVMQGYLNRPEKTSEVLVDGWYNTGDIASVDEDGFLRITDRLSRFSKIGGEMVPHIKIEEKLQEIAEATEQAFAVTAVPDERKGEKLVVLHTLNEDHLKAVLEKFAKSDLPALWRPRSDQFFRIEGLPYLGTGKLDLRRLRELAVELSGKD